MRAEAEGRRTGDIERDRTTFNDPLPLQGLQVKVAHCEAFVRQNRKILDEQYAQATKRLERLSHLAPAERDLHGTDVDLDAEELRKSLRQALLGEVQAADRRVEDDETSLQAQLELMQLQMNEMKREMLNIQNSPAWGNLGWQQLDQISMSVGGNPGWQRENPSLRTHNEKARGAPLPSSPPSPRDPKPAPTVLLNEFSTSLTKAMVDSDGEDLPSHWPDSLRRPYDMELQKTYTSWPPPEVPPTIRKSRPDGDEGQMLDFQDLLAVCMIGEELRKFMNEWGVALAGMRESPEDDVLETLIWHRVRRHSGLRVPLARYERLPAGHAEKLQALGFYRQTILVARRRGIHEPGPALDQEHEPSRTRNRRHELHGDFTRLRPFPCRLRRYGHSGKDSRRHQVYIEGPRSRRAGGNHREEKESLLGSELWRTVLL